MSHNPFFEALESRQLMSASPVLFNPTILKDRLEVRIDLLKFKLDVHTSGTKLGIDYHHIKKVTPAGDTSLDDSISQLRTDGATLGSDLKNDRLAEQANALADESTIKLDILQLRKDKGNADAQTTDRAKLKNDRIQLQTDLLAGLDSRITTRQSYETTISNDTQAVVTAAANDTAATPAFTAAVNKFSEDRVTRLNVLTADLQTIETARQKLANDLTAAESN